MEPMHLTIGGKAVKTSSKWYEYFEQVNVSGASLSPSALLDANVKLRKPEAQKTGG